MLYPLLNKRSPIQLKTKMSILKMYVSPMLTNAVVTWAQHVSTNQWKRLESIQTIGLCTTTGLQRYLRNQILLKPSNMIEIKLVKYPTPIKSFIL